MALKFLLLAFGHCFQVGGLYRSEGSLDVSSASLNSLLSPSAKGRSKKQTNKMKQKENLKLSFLAFF